MRDIINQLTYLLEDRTLNAGVIKKYPERFDKFIDMIRTGKPFYTLEKEPVVADPEEADRFEELHATDQFKGNLKIKLQDGNELALSQLLKSADLGGEASTGAEGEETGKEAALLKPSQIGITDKNIPAIDLGQAIINNKVLRSTDYGRVVIEMAKAIMDGQDPVIPKEVPTKIRQSIIDYAGEYLGVLALVSGTSRFPRRKGFEEWLGGQTQSLTINFPSKANNNIADSFASISNEETNHKVNISSKGKGGGAPPSVGGLKVPPEIRNNPDYEASVALIDLCDPDNNLPPPKTVSQVFQAMNLLQQYAPEAIPKQFNKFLPWKQSIVSQVTDSMNAFKSRKPDTLQGYDKLWSGIDFKKPSSNGGRLTHAVKLAVMNAVNEGQAFPEFQDVILAILDMNFIQQYADYDSKSKVMSFATQWPAKLEGKVSLMSKAGATDPTKGGFSFKLANTSPKTEIEEPDEGGTDSNVSDLPSAGEFTKGAEKIALGKVKKPSNTPTKMGDVGRKLRQV